ncbi:MAG TPA: HD domain-containing protein [Roseiflexaceae bacterium]|nr:HD domain-containing protein [Roseiflexaceae bacterium]
MYTNRIARIEQHARAIMATIEPAMAIAHDWKHIDRVRRRALHIAQQEGFADVALVEAAALLHDIGLASVTERSQHARVGAQQAAQWLRKEQLFNEAEIEAIAAAIHAHGATIGGGMLGSILRDADILDLLGAVGIMRACTSKYNKPEYDPQQLKGETWGMNANDFTQRFQQGLGIGPHLVDQINFQISCYDNLQTTTARTIGQPLVVFMRAWLVQFEAEIATMR